MRKQGLSSIAIALTAALFLAGCGHKVVATPGQNQVPIFHDEDTYKQLAQLKAQGGLGGMLGGMGENVAAGKVDNNTPVRILSSDDLGSQVEITDGPLKGTKGFVPKANVD